MQIPGYDILEKVRESGTIVTWKATQLSLDRPVLVNVVRLDGSEEDNDRNRGILKQVKDAASLKHPGLIEVLAVEDFNNASCVITACVEGRSLADRLAEEPRMKEKEALKVVYDVAAALGHAWTEKRLLHGNLKPSNIIFDKDTDATKVSRLGFAGKEKFKDEITNDDREIVLGTPNYMSPEQCEGRSAIDCRSDLYAMGAILYQMLTGAIPFDGLDGAEIMARQISERIANPRDLNHEVSIGTTALIARLMAKKREDRIGSWKVLAGEIRRISSGRVFIQKEGHAPASTIQPAKVAPPVSLRSRRSTHVRRPMATKDLAIMLVKWGLVLAIWILLACRLLKLPPPPI